MSSQNGIEETSYSRVNLTTKPEPTAPVTTTTSSGALTTGWIVAIALLALVALIFLVLLIWYLCVCYRKRRYDYKNGKEPLARTEHWLDYYQENVDTLTPRGDNPPTAGGAVYGGYWSPTYEFTDTRHVVFSEWLEIKDGGDSPDNNKPYITFEQEYNNLPRGQEKPWTVAALYPHLNRVSHLVAYDYNRVKIRNSPLNADYINASYIDGFSKKNSYIATTSPFSEECIYQFWQMIYEQNVSQIVMMTNMVDEGIVKCLPYWPETAGQRIQYGSVYVETTDVDVFAYFTIYRIKLTHVGDYTYQRVVTQFHYTGWPKHGVPRTTFPILHFRQVIRSRCSSNSGPAVVHCGTGCSTTGFYIALDYLIEESQRNSQSVNVFKAVSHLRQYRSGMVRTQKQYLFLYDCLFEFILGGDKVVSHDLKSKFKLLSKTNPESGHSYFQEELEQLVQFTPEPRKDELSTAATLDVNRKKNRYGNVLPPDTHRVKLSLEHGTNDYINAVCIDRHRERNAFILTQTPLADTVNDFWRMVYEQGVRSIIMMDDYKLVDETCAIYWPTHFDKRDVDLNMTHASGDGYRTRVFGEFLVKLVSEEQEADVCVVRHLSLYNKLQPQEQPRDIKQFQILEWPLNKTKPPKTGLALLKLMNTVEKWQHSQLDAEICRVIVHCLDGAAHSALYVAAATICDRMACEESVNIFLSVKEIKHRRQEALTNVHQYKYLHRVLWDYINAHVDGRQLNTSDQSGDRQTFSATPHRSDLLEPVSYNDDVTEGAYQDYPYGDSYQQTEQSVMYSNGVYEET